jgi:predicted glycosyltransferase
LTVVPKKVLIAPLNWGLGHATRCIPLIEQHIAEGCDVHIASDGDALKILQKEFKNLQFHTLPAYDVKYGTEDNFFTSLLFQLPSLMKNVSKEFVSVQQLQKEYGFDLIISDNRPGVKSKRAKSVYLTHQLEFKVKYGSRLGHRFHKMLYKDFDEVWVPDVEPPQNLAGKLSVSKDKKVKYIGHLTRAQKVLEAKLYDVLLLLSGPEPQRSKLEDELYRQLKSTKLKVALIRGTSVPRLRTNPKFTIIDLATSAEVDKLVAQSKVVMARTGYSTLMDLAVWQKPCVLVPTPGQPEQEYLGEYIKSQGWALVTSQKEISVKTQIEEAKPFAFQNYQEFRLPK